MSPPAAFLYGFDPVLHRNVYFTDKFADSTMFYAEKRLEARAAVIRETMSMRDYLDLRFDLEDMPAEKRPAFTFRDNKVIQEFVREMGGHGRILDARVLAYVLPETGEIYAIAKANGLQDK